MLQRSLVLSFNSLEKFMLKSTQASYQAQLNCANTVPKSQTSEALGMEKKKMMMKEVKSSYLVIPLHQHCHIHRSPRKPSETTSGWFLKVKSCLLVCFAMITLHCIVWVAILFPGHHHIESATTLSDIAITAYKLIGLLR